jgi:hypothetical protein
VGDVSPVVAAAGAIVTDLGNGTIQKGDGMTDTDDRRHRSILQRVAHRAMLERWLVPDFPPQALAECMSSA